MTSSSALRLGTRDSLLARAQSRLVQRALQNADPGLRIELVTMQTRGDRQLDVPLATVRDPDFFSAELDEALVGGAVDLCVHSLKDLPLAPRAGIVTAAIPPRENPRDVVVFRPDILALLRAGERLRIGSCSDRRVEFTAAFLRDALPRLHERPVALEFPSLRGTVEARVARLRLPREDDASLDGVVLALAGLARLWGDRDAHAQLASLLDGTRVMVLPVTECPVAPGQGALAVDCRAGDSRVREILARINHEPSARRAQRELTLLRSQPETERNAFGATTVRHPVCGTLLYTRNRRGGHLIWQPPPRPQSAQAWDGADWAGASGHRPLPRTDLGQAGALFFAHWRALPAAAKLAANARVWVSGVRSWRRFAERGIWVEGCAEDLGFDAIIDTLRSPVLRLPPLADWTAVTRSDATGSWASSGVGRAVATYAIEGPRDDEALDRIRAGIARATHFYWGSAAQFRALRPWLPRDGHHACGPGKTYTALQSSGVGELHAFPSRQEWRSWVA